MGMFEVLILCGLGLGPIAGALAAVARSIHGVRREMELRRKGGGV